nr:MAG TPA: hypothetical protein [Caudoviricetes sp.]DAN31788.1 MAG TPA: hypothetical protein [Caudoviricetes sp.]
MTNSKARIRLSAQPLAMTGFYRVTYKDRVSIVGLKQKTSKFNYYTTP